MCPQLPTAGMWTQENDISIQYKMSTVMFAMNNHRAETCTVWSLFELNEVYSSQNVKQLLEVWSVEPLMFLSLKDGQRFYMLYYEVSTDFVDNLCGYRWYQFIWLFVFILGWHTACWLQVMLKITSQLHDDLCRHVVIRWRLVKRIGVTSGSISTPDNLYRHTPGTFRTCSERTLVQE